MSATKGFGPSRSHAVPAASGQGGSVSVPSAPGAAWAATGLLAWARTAPVALAGLADDGSVAWVNPAFEALTGCAAAQATGTALEPLLADVASPAWLPPAGELARRRLRRQDGTPLTCDVQCDPIGPGLRVLTLVVRDAEPALDAEIRRLAALLEFVQVHARIGMWERDVRTREGRWDAHMFRFFGIDPGRGTPSIAQIVQASVPQDRLFQVLDESMRAPGLYAHRYRLLTPTGALRRVQAHWEVFAGADGRPDHVVGLVMDDTETFELASSLDEAGAQLQLATELADVSMWRHDLVTQRLHLNARAADVLGLQARPEGIPVDELRAHVHPDDLMEVLATYQRALRSYRTEDLTARYRHRDGSWHHIFTRRVTQRDAFGTPIAFSGVALDVTDQVERMQRSDELARRLDDVTAASGIGVWRVRRDGGGAVEWNAQMHALFGVPESEGAPPEDAWVERCVHPDDREYVADLVRAQRSRPDSSVELAYRIVQPDGQVRHVVARAHAEPETSAYRVTGVIIDVTERELALAALREATERSALATRAAGIGIWEWDADTGVSRWDDEMFVLRGLEPRPTCPTFDEMSQWVHPDDRSYVNDQIQSARIEDRSAYYEFRITRADGVQRWLASRSLPVRDERGRTRMRLGGNWDITEAHEAAAARHERALVLRESQAKSELLARMSHELRTPMNAVLGFTQLLLADDAIQGGAQESTAAALTRHARLEHIRSAGEHLLTLINNVLELSRLDGPERGLVLQPVQVGSVTAATLPLVEGLAQQHGVSVVAPPSPLWVRADPVRLKQVLVNLLTNAIKYNRSGGSVHVDVTPDAGHVLIRVADDGIGMTSAQQTEAFEPFNRAGAERDGIEGTGIGLTIVKALVEGMGGRIGVNSARGVGSVFEVCLDAAAQSGPHALPTRRLLYVEDNSVNVLIVSELVRRRGDIEFDSVPDGASGVARATQSLPGLTLVDMQLPDIDGLEVLARLRANPQTAGLYVVALSANAIPGDIQRALAAGFDDYWTKPLDFAVFNAALDRVFGAQDRAAGAAAPDAPAM